MSSSCDFYATKEELIHIVELWLRSHAIYAVAIEYNPFVLRVFSSDLVRLEVCNMSVRRIAFTEEEPNCEASGNMDFLDKNAGVYILDLGRLSLDGLIASRLSSTASSKVGRKLTKDLIKRTTAGLWGIHDKSGAIAFYRTFRYTNGAGNLSVTGTALRCFPGSPVTLQSLQPRSIKKK